MSLLCWGKHPGACFPGCELLLGTDADPSCFSCCSSLWAEGRCFASLKAWKKEEHSVFRELPSSAFPKASLSHLLDLLDFHEKLILFGNGLLIFVFCVSLPVGVGFPAELPSCNHVRMLQEDLFWWPCLPGISGDSGSGRFWPIA